MRRATPAVRAAALHPLTAIIALGVALRVAAMAGYRPAYAVFSDTEAYVATAATNGYVSAEPLRPVGYSAFLDALHAIVASMTFVTVVQHRAAPSERLKPAAGQAYWALVPYTPQAPFRIHLADAAPLEVAGVEQIADGLKRGGDAEFDFVVRDSISAGC